MNLLQTGLLPEKLKIKGQRIDVERENKAWNDAIDQIAQIPFDPVKFVEVDEGELRQIVNDNCYLLYNNPIRMKEFSHILASTKERWMKVKEPSP